MRDTIVRIPASVTTGCLFRLLLPPTDRESNSEEHHTPIHGGC